MSTQRSPRVERWFAALLVVSVLVQAATALLRPMLSYRALEIGLGPTLLGLVAAAFAVVPLVVALRMGRLVDRGNETWFTVAGMVAIAAAGVAVAASSALPVLLIGSAVLGLGHLAVVVATQALVASASSEERYDRRFAHVAFVASLGQLIGPALGGAIAGDGSPSGTTAALVAGGLLGLLGVPFALAMLGGNRVADRSRDGGAAPIPLMMILRSPGMAPTMIASLTVLVAVDMLMVYLPALGEEAGWAPSTVGALLAVRAGASMVSRLGLGQMSDRVGRTGLLVGSMALAAGAIVALPLVGGLGAAFAFMAVAGFALGLGQPLTVSAVAAQSLPGARGTALSVRMMGNRFGQVAVPVAAGLVAGVAGAGGVLALTGVAVGVSTALVAGSSGWSRGRAAGPGSGTVAPSADPEPSAGG